MNLRYTLLAGVFAFAGLTSCEMKDELLNKGEESTEVGYLDLGLAVDASSQSVTKADEATQTNPVVSAQGFDVEIFKKNEETAYKTFTYDGEMEPVELPVGDYTVYAHSEGKTTDIKYKSEPFYGKEMPFSVEPNKTYDVTVVCTMMNTKIQLTYDQELDDVFKSWNITVTDGTNIEEFKYEEESGEAEQPSPFYWFIAENVSIIKVEFTGRKKEDNAVITESRSITKTSTSGSQYWEAADALSVTIKPGEKDPTNPSGVTGIEISANLNWNTDGKTDNIEVTVEDSTTPSEPGGNESEDEGDGEVAAPTLEGKYLGKTVTFDKGGNDPFPDVTVKMNVPGLIQNVMIKATTTDPDLEGAFNPLGFLNEPDGVDLVDNSILGGMGMDLPVSGKDFYEFVLGSLGGMLTVGEHTFTVKVIDQKGQSVSGALSFSIKNSSVTE